MAENKKQLSDSLEDYLEIILALEKQKKVARVKDIAAEMGVLRGSVTSALKKLSSKELINYEPYSFITLTARGKRLAEEVTQRHGIIKNFLVEVLQLGADNAESNACRMEHAIDSVALERLVRFIDYLNNCPRTGPDWITSFAEYCKDSALDKKKCESCLSKCNSNFNHED
ncbi:metal-dependent transcriptional regulator [Thermodesulfobacteriota bacterium]